MTALFGKAPKAQKPAPVVPVPDTNDPNAERARRDAILASQKRGGRQSTILSSGGDALGSASGGTA